MAESFRIITKPVTNTEYSQHVRKYAQLNLDAGPWVAGGSVRKIWFNEPWETQDVDFFFSNYAQFDRVVSNVKRLYKSTQWYDMFSMSSVDRPTLLTHETNNAITWTIELQSGKTYKIQAIKKYWPKSIHELFSTFDLTVSQFATDGVTMIATAAAVEDSTARVIRLVNPEHPISINRLLKYTAYGFSAPDSIMKNVVDRLVAGEQLEANDDY